jgi:hypothetical protein
MAFPMKAPDTAPIQQEGIQGKPPSRPPTHPGAFKAAALFRKGGAKKKAPLPPAPSPGSMPEGGAGW